MLTVNLHLACSTYCDGQELIHREMEKGHTLQPESLCLVRDSHNAVCMNDGGELATIKIAVSGAKEKNFSMNFQVQMSHPSDFEKPDVNSHLDKSSFDGHESFPFEMADEYVAGEGPSGYDNYAQGGYDNYAQDDYDPIEEPPYMDEPDIPERV